MPRKCMVPGCLSNSNKKIGKYVPTFSFPFKNPELLKKWIENTKVRTPLSPFDTICLIHFNSQDISRSVKVSDEKGNTVEVKKTKLGLKKSAIPVLNLDLAESTEVKTYRKKSQTPPPAPASTTTTTSGARAHLKRNVRRSEDVERLLRGKSFSYESDEMDSFDFDKLDEPMEQEEKKKKKPPRKSIDGRKRDVKIKQELSEMKDEDQQNLQQLEIRPTDVNYALEDLIVELSEKDQENDSYLNGKELSLEALYRIHLHLFDSILPVSKAGRVKVTPRESTDPKEFQLLNNLKGFDPDKSPIFWTKHEVNQFITSITKNQSLAELFEDYEIDGVALLSIKNEDLIKYLNLEKESAEFLGKVIVQLKKETVHKFVQIQELPENEWEIHSL